MPPAHSEPPTRRRRLATRIAAAALVLAGCAAALTASAPARAPRPVPVGQAPAAHPGSGRAAPLPAGYTIPGTAPRLPWPARGQATVEVLGLGSLGSSGGQAPVPIASLTKVMTAYLVLRGHPLTATGSGPAIRVTAAEAAAYPRQLAAHESVVPVAAGEVLTERQALTALLLPSAGNIARILARWAAGSVPAFVARMNAVATVLGMSGTHYADPAGVDPGSVSTAADQVLLAERAMAVPAFAQLVRQSTGVVPLAGTVRNYNAALGADGVIGIKTGSTSAAGGCLLFAATRTVAGRTATIIGAVLGQPGPVMYGLPQALAASQRLIRATAAALGPYTLVRPGQRVASTGDGQPLVAREAATVVGWPGLAYRAVLDFDGAGTAGTLRLTPDTGILDADAAAGTVTGAAAVAVGG